MAQVKDHLVSVALDDGSASVAVTLHGACVYSWKHEGAERLFTSSKSPLEGPAPVRGGIPICFPVFGPPPQEAPFNQLSQHGFARKSKWTYEGQITGLGEGSAGLRFSLKPSSEISAVFRPPFTLLYEVVIHKQGTLSCTLKVGNPSDSDDLRFQALFHNYLQLPSNSSLSDTTVEGLQGLQYLDKPDGAKEKHETGAVTFSGEVDRVYMHAPSKASLQSGGKTFLEIEKEGLEDFVTWNPAQAKGDALKDLQSGGWKEYVCLEPGYCQEFVTLKPGQTHECKQTLRASKI